MTVRPHSGHVGQLTAWFYTFVKSKKLVLAFSFSIHLSFSHSRQNACLQTQDRPVVATRAVKAGADREGVRDGSCPGGGHAAGPCCTSPGAVQYPRETVAERSVRTDPRVYSRHTLCLAIVNRALKVIIAFVLLTFVHSRRAEGAEWLLTAALPPLGAFSPRLSPRVSPDHSGRGSLQISPRHSFSSPRSLMSPCLRGTLPTHETGGMWWNYLNYSSFTLFFLLFVRVV